PGDPDPRDPRRAPTETGLFTAHHARARLRQAGLPRRPSAGRSAHGGPPGRAGRMGARAGERAGLVPRRDHAGAGTRGAVVAAAPGAGRGLLDLRRAAVRLLTALGGGLGVGAPARVPLRRLLPARPGA